MFPIAELADRHGSILTFHCGRGDDYSASQPVWFLDLGEVFPKVNIILLHMGFRIVHDAVAVAKRNTNIYLETAANSPARIMMGIKGVGSDRVYLWYGCTILFARGGDTQNKIYAGNHG